MRALRSRRVLSSCAVGAGVSSNSVANFIVQPLAVTAAVSMAEAGKKVDRFQHVVIASIGKTGDERADHRDQRLRLLDARQVPCSSDNLVACGGYQLRHGENEFRWR